MPITPFDVPPLPPTVDLESRPLLRRLPQVHRVLAEFKGTLASIPNEAILINTLAIQEARDSSAIENIITTQDDYYRAELQADDPAHPAAKEVQHYTQALYRGFQAVRKKEWITVNCILSIQQELILNRAGLRKLPGTNLKNPQTGEIVYTPPQDPRRIADLMTNLETYINMDGPEDPDPLIKMAVLHYQFESIHPFYDGNGRTGRILNILYLVLKKLLDLPVLYLSRYFIQHKGEYYRGLQSIREEGSWEEWVHFVLDGVEKTALDGIQLIKAIRALMDHTQRRIRAELPKLYSKDLLENLFKHPYTKIEFVIQDTGVTRLTAARHLDQLASIGLLEKQKIWRTNYYVHTELYALLLRGGAAPVEG